MMTRIAWVRGMLCWGVLVGLAGCRAAAADPPRDAAAEQERPTSWTDPRVVAEMEKDCAFDPDKLEGAARARWMDPEMGPGDSSPLSCEGYFDQSCVFDPCFEEGEERCKPRCHKECHACGASCAGACAACKKGCKDAACKRGCAARCGACREECVRKHDRCATGGCTQEYKQCRQRLKQEWLKNRCPALCKKYVSCERACLKKQKDDYEGCRTKCAPAKTACNLGLCQGGEMTMGIDPMGE